MVETVACGTTRTLILSAALLMVSTVSEASETAKCKALSKHDVCIATCYGTTPYTPGEYDSIVRECRLRCDLMNENENRG